MKIFTLILSLIFIPFTYAGTLSSNNGLEILAVNGIKLKSKTFADKTIDLEDGKHQVAIQYSGIFDKHNGSVDSKVHIFMVETHGDTTISVKKFRRATQAENAIKAGLVFLIKSDNDTVEIKGSDTIDGEGFMPYSEIEGLVATYNQQNHIAIAAVAGTVVATSNIEMTKAIESGTTSSDDLIKLYNSADKAQRKAFRVWLIEQDMK